MKLSHLCAATALLATTTMAAQAAPIVLDLADGSASFSSDAAEQEFQFTLEDPSIGDGTVTATFGPKSGYLISGITFNGQQLIPDVNTAHFTNYTLFEGPLAAGNYAFTVTGLPRGGEYTGRVEVSAVPEPQSMGYLLVGLAAMGLVVSSRRKVL